MIRRAERNESELLTGISFAAKKYWNYPAHYFTIWKEELTITPGYIDRHDVYVYEQASQVCGFYSLVELRLDMETEFVTLPAGLWLDHMFLQPEYIGQGLGRQLFRHCLSVCRVKEHAELHILADPNAQGFYLRMGCCKTGDFPSSIAGRTTPHLEYRLNPL